MNDQEQQGDAAAGEGAAADATTTAATGTVGEGASAGSGEGEQQQGDQQQGATTAEGDKPKGKRGKKADVPVADGDGLPLGEPRLPVGAAVEFARENGGITVMTQATVAGHEAVDGVIFARLSYATAVHPAAPSKVEESKLQLIAAPTAQAAE